jgi:hypothetical protein
MRPCGPLAARGIKRPRTREVPHFQGSQGVLPGRDSQWAQLAACVSEGRSRANGSIAPTMGFRTGEKTYYFDVG